MVRTRTRSAVTSTIARPSRALDLAEVKRDIEGVLTTSQDWWPADFGHYGPFMIRMAWHSAAPIASSTGAAAAGPGSSASRPLNSWPDNGNLDKARRLLWPVKKKYGSSLSWGDLIILAGNVALESMGFATFGFAGGRIDAWEPDDDVYWGSGDRGGSATSATGERDLDNPLAAVQMGLICRPRGANANPDPLASAIDIRDTFGRMAMDDSETVALIAGGHVRQDARRGGPRGIRRTGAGGRAIAGQRTRLAEHLQHRQGRRHDHERARGDVDLSPDALGQRVLPHPVQLRWELFKSPAGAASQWRPKNGAGSDVVPEAHGPGRREPRMLTSISRSDSTRSMSRSRATSSTIPGEFADAFARAWFKLTHRDMGPVSRYLGAEVPGEELLWQDPIPANDRGTTAEDIAAAKAAIAEARLSVAQLVKTAWAAASCFRGSDKRGGANGGRIRSSRSAAGRRPADLALVLARLEEIQSGLNISFADLVVLAGNVRDRAGGCGGRGRGRGPVHPGPRRRGPGADRHRVVPAISSPRPTGSATTSATTAGSLRNITSSTRPALLGLTAPGDRPSVGGLRASGSTAAARRRGAHRPGRDAEHGLVRQPPRPRHVVDAGGRRG